MKGGKYGEQITAEFHGSRESTVGRVESVERQVICKTDVLLEM
jgi:hypothetical protein